ncbi:MAG: excinuclease ABC subunit UvrC [Patescibacteria group bacterium]
MTHLLTEKVGRLPTKPGVYLFKDENQNVLYVGKAKNLKSRVASYFSSRHLDRPWVAVMISLIDDVETIVVNNELEALILESTLISEHQPKFNIKLTDDKAYPFIKLTLNEPFPRFQIVRSRAKDGAKYFGPYLSAWSARLTCEFLRRLYGVHISNRSIRPLDSARGKPCLNCQLEGNSCPLAGEISEETYGFQVQKVIRFLLGKRATLSRDIETRMADAAEKHRFELAAKLRDQLRAVRQNATNQDVIGSTREDFDVIAAAKANLTAVVTLMSVRSGALNGQRSFNFNIVADQTTGEVIRQFLLNFYQNFQSVPALVALAEPIDDQQLIADWLAEIHGHKVELRIAKRGEKIDFTALAKKNAQAKLESGMMNEELGMMPLIALKELLNLPALPLRIEAVDISNLGTSEAVGATVCFINGQPEKSEYRRYKIKTVEGQNDFAMIAEVTARRFADTSRPLPDLFVVDGGPEQLATAFKAAEQLATSNWQSSQMPEARSQKPRFIALAKKPDRIFLPGKKKPLAVSRGHKGLLQLARIRDETHRYVIGFHRHRQRKKSLNTIN